MVSHGASLRMAWSNKYLPGFMMLFGSSIRLTFFITSQPPPISSGTSSASPTRVVPWQLLMEPPYFSDTRASSA